MGEYTVAHLDEIEELNDGREPWRPVRHHFGITAFGLTAWTGQSVGDRIINEHDEADDGQEGLYLVHGGRGRLGVGGKRQEARPGPFFFVPPGVQQRAFAEERGRTI